MKIRIRLILLIICYLLGGCTRPSSRYVMDFDNMRNPVTTPNNEIISKHDYKLLDSAFNLNSKELLKQYFEEWRDLSIVKQDSTVSKNVYKHQIKKVLISFFRPDTIGLKDYKSMIYKMKVEKKFHGTDEEFIEKFNADRFLGDLKYYVAQNTVVYSIFPDSIFDKVDFFSERDRRLYEIKMDSVVGIDYSESPLYDKILIYDYDHYKVFNEYLNASNRDPVHNTIKEIGERRRKRIEFVEEYLSLVPEHWGNGWHIETFPYTYRININESRNKAHIEFRGSFNTGGNADMNLIDSVWHMSKFNAFTWIE